MTPAEIWTSVAVAIGGIAAGVTAWRKTSSSDSVEATKDRAEEGLIERLVERADAETARADAADTRADAISDALNLATRELALSNASLAAQKEKNVKLHRALIRMAEGLPPELRKAWEQALETDFSPLGGPETK